MTTDRVLVPVSESVTIRQTVSYAVSSGLERSDHTLECHLVAAIPYDDRTPEGERRIDDSNRFLDRVASWVREDAEGAPVEIETAVIGTDEYLFGPSDYARAFGEYADEHEIDRVVLDPEYRSGPTGPLLEPFERDLRTIGLEFEEAPISRPARHQRLIGSGTESFDKAFAMFFISYGFYLVLGDPTYWFDLVTGAAVAGIVSISLAQVTWSFPLDRTKSPIRTLRFAIYIPYLVFEIVKANLAISVVILRPSMPIDPKLTRVHARVRAGLPLLALANSITLTPGTLTVRANDQRLIVHTLIPTAREDLFDGGLERAVRFIFHGREAARISTPRERGDAEIIGGDEL